MQTYRPAIRWWSLVDMRLMAHFSETLDVTEDRFVLTRGLLAKSETVVPFSRITNYSVSQSMLDRIFGLCNYIIETASSPLPEINLRGYPQALRDTLSRALGTKP